MATTVLFSTFPPFPTLSLSVPSTTLYGDLAGLLSQRYPELPNPHDLRLSLHRGLEPEPHTSLESLHDGDASLVSLRLTPRLRGGKGGFGSQLRAAGGRMSSQKTSNNDSCRDLSGRRLSTIKEAKKLAEYLESEPERKKAAAEVQKAKLEALERKVGMGGNSEQVAGQKRRLDDTEYLEQSREIVDGVKSAVTAAMLKKKKKAKTVSSTESKDAEASTSASAPAKKTAEPASQPSVATTSAAVVTASA